METQTMKQSLVTGYGEKTKPQTPALMVVPFTNRKPYGEEDTTCVCVCVCVCPEQDMN
jgi:hypothetical protein